MAQLKAGAAKVKMTPTGDAWPAMGMLPNQEYTKVHDDIYVRVLVLDNGEKKVVFLAMELQRAFFADEIREYLQEKYGIDPGYVFLNGTHTHEGPNLAGIPKDYGGDDTSGEWGERYRVQVIAHMKEAADQALASLRPARIGFGEGKNYINVCRDRKFENGVWGQGPDFGGPSDKTLAALKVVDEDGKLIAAILNYACHGVVCFLQKDAEGNLMLSGDVPGMISAYVEERYSEQGTVCLWTPAAEGNQNPIYVSKFLSYGQDKIARETFDPGLASWDLCRSLAEDQGSTAVQLLESICANEGEARFAASHRTMDVPGRDLVFHSDSFEEILAMRNGALAFDGHEVDGEPVNFIFHLLTVNDIAFFYANGELVTEIGMRLKERSPLKNIMIITNCEGKAGYVPDRSGYERKTFEYFGSRIKDGRGEEYATKAMMEMFADRK